MDKQEYKNQETNLEELIKKQHFVKIDGEWIMAGPKTAEAIRNGTYEPMSKEQKERNREELLKRLQKRRENMRKNQEE